VLVLALDTSSAAVVVGLVDRADGRLVAGRTVVDGRRHGEVLAVGIREVLAEAGIAATGLDAVVVGLGPGPFTGLRVGVVTAASLSDALGIPAYGVCSLDAVGEGPRLVLADARRREVYWARYDNDGGRLEGPAVERPADLAARLTGDVPLVGPGAALYRDVFAGLPVDDTPLSPDPVRLVALAGIDGPPQPLTPLYLRRPDAEQPGKPKRVTA
jgi:tRNA threonylcarbamoyl adenosine modification protein YeaZ